MMKTEIAQLTFDMQVNLEVAVITSLRSNWSLRSHVYNRKRVRENMELLRFIRTHYLMGHKYSFAS